MKKTNKGATHRRNPPGTNVGWAAAKARRIGYAVYARPVFHGGELTDLNKARAARRLAMWGV